jgi:SAM-dependent methyltransferase
MLSESISKERRMRIRRRLHRIRRPAILGTLRRTAPLSDQWGRDRGTPIDRYYIEQFLDRKRASIRGHVLEVLDSGYTLRFGSGVTRSDVLDIDPSNPDATIVADLAAADAVPSQTFDCFILTQTLQFIYDVRAALSHVHRILKPGGVVLCTVPSVSRIGRRYLESEYWRFTPASARKLFAERFGEAAVAVEARGNVLTSIAFLTGMSAEELSSREMEALDPFFPLVVTICASR